VVTRLLLLVLNFAFLISAVAAQSFPKAAGRVNDFANVIDPATEAAIDQQLDQLEQQTSSEIAVATIASLDGMSVEEYANRLFKEWGVGQSKADNGVLILVAPAAREMRIEVGYGLEGVLPDGLAGQVIRDDFTPRFRDNDYSGGIRDGVSRVVKIVERHRVLTPEELAQFDDLDQKQGDSAVLIFFVPFFSLFVAIGFAVLGIGLGTGTGFPKLFGTLFGGLPLLISLLFLGWVALISTIPIAVVALWLGRRLGGKTAVRDFFRSGGKSMGWNTATTSSDSDSDSSSSSSSSSSDSDFGGGSSGGGGASGRW